MDLEAEKQAGFQLLLRAIVRRAAIDYVYQRHKWTPQHYGTARRLFEDLGIHDESFIRHIADRKMNDE